MNPLIERLGNELIRTRHLSNRVRSGHQHLIGKAGHARGESALEQAGEREHVVDSLAIGGEGSAPFPRE